MTGRYKDGTSRVAALAATLNLECVINLQGDEPTVKPEDLLRLAEFMRTHHEYYMVTLAAPFGFGQNYDDRNLVKVTSAGYRALYFSRAPIEGAMKHVGVYGFHCPIPPRDEQSPLTIAEGLEQMFWLESGVRIGVLKVDEPTYAVDVPEDLKWLETHANA